MAICVMQTWSEHGPGEIYQGVNEKMNFPEEPIDGLIVHTAGDTPDGFRILDVWESQDHFDRFFQGKLSDAVLEVTGDDPRKGEGNAPTVETWELVAAYTG